jgi:hypothetical protein
MAILRVVYRHGIVKNAKNLKGLTEEVFSGNKIPRDVIAAIEENNLLDAGGTYGDPDTSEPLQYDYLKIDHSNGRLEITFYNRGMSMLSADDETEQQIDRVCLVLERLATA